MINSFLPGGLEVDGELNIKGESKFHKASWFQNQKKPNVWSHMNWGDGKAYFRGDIVMDGYGGTGKDLHVRTINGKNPLGRGDHVKIHSRGGWQKKGTHQHYGLHVAQNRYLVAFRDGNPMELS